MLLRDLGATIDKLEDPEGGDYLRHLPPQVDGENALFRALNRGKRSIALDLKDAVSKETFLALIAHYDVILEQFRPGVLGRLGLSPASLLEAKPTLVVCSISGYGQSGPSLGRAGHDINYLARAGVLGFQGPPGEPPAVPGFQIADVGGALYAVTAIVAALRTRDRTGEGAHLDISMTEAAMGFALSGLAHALEGVPGSPRLHGTGELAGGIAPYRTYATKDGRYVALGALEPKFWFAFCKGVGIPEDPTALLTGPHQQEHVERLEKVFKSRTFGEWKLFSETHDVCLEPVLTPAETLEDPHLNARGVFAGPLGQTRGFRSPLVRAFTESGSAAAEASGEETALGAVPRQGEHTAEVLAEAGLGNRALGSKARS